MTIVFLALSLTLGCATSSGPMDGDVIFLVPGVDGPGARCVSLIQGLRDAGIDRRIEVVSWGAPFPFTMMNFSSARIHREAEDSLAKRIDTFQVEHPGAKFDLIGHSAGCGVILGALKRLPDQTIARSVILLAPSVSPAYPLRDALAHAQVIDSFNSDRDTLFLRWRTGHFGTYDNIKTPAAGYAGFDAEHDARLIQHAYDPHWKSLDNDGGHFGGTSKRFVSEIIAPLLNAPPHVAR